MTGSSSASPTRSNRPACTVSRPGPQETSRSPEPPGASGRESWAVPGAAAGLASPLAVAGCVYVPREAFLGCYDAATGREHYRERLPGFRSVIASPVAVGRKVLILDESGQAMVIEAGPHFRIVGQSKLDDRFWASPAVARRAPLLRGVRFLYRLRD